MYETTRPIRFELTSELNVDYFVSNLEIYLSNCKGLPFIDKYHKHIFTNDIWFIEYRKFFGV